MSQWNLTTVRRFVWYNWLLLLELDVLNYGEANESIEVARKYTWGLDLARVGPVSNRSASVGPVSSRSSSTGPVPIHSVSVGPVSNRSIDGGLLACYDTGDTSNPAAGGDDKSYIYFYDANGNVGQVMDLSSSSTTPAARYEYDAYGNIVGPDADADGDWLEHAGPYAAENPWRFSTKWWDAETGFGYWGYRYYDAVSGRWLSRDPIGINDGPTEYAYVRNQVTTAIDPDGRITVTTIMQNNLPCGGRRVRWDFRLDNPAPCDGYIIAKVTVYEKIEACGACCCPVNETPLEPRIEYFEAWRVLRGQQQDTDPVGWGYTDQEYEASRFRTCGTRASTADLIFVCDDAGRLGDEGAQGPYPGWSPGGIPRAGDLPAAPYNEWEWFLLQFWAKERGYRDVSDHWDCCSKQQFNDLYVKP